MSKISERAETIISAYENEQDATGLAMLIRFAVEQRMTVDVALESIAVALDVCAALQKHEIAKERTKAKPPMGVGDNQPTKERCAARAPANGGDQCLNAAKRGTDLCGVHLRQETYGASSVRRVPSHGRQPE